MTGTKYSVYVLFLAILATLLIFPRPAAAGYWWYKIGSDDPSVVVLGDGPGLGIGMAKESYYSLYTGGPPTPTCGFLYSLRGELSGARCVGKSRSASCRSSESGPWNCAHSAWLECSDDEVRTAVGCVAKTEAEIAPEPQSCSGSGGNPQSENPVAILSGAKLEHAVDYRGAGPLPLVFDRQYRSNVVVTASTAATDTSPETARSMFGRAWRSPFDTGFTFINSANFSTPSDGHRVNLVMPSGEEIAFIYSSAQAAWRPAYYDDAAGSWRSGRTSFDVTLTVVNSGGVAEARVLYPDDATHVFDFNGRLTAVRHRSGQVLTMAYDGSHLASVTDGFGRTLQFSYNASGLVSTMTAPDGGVYAYTYLDRSVARTADAAIHGEYVLETVAFPDATPSATDNPTVRYHYENADLPYALTGITDERGVRFATFAYDDLGRAVETTHADGADRTAFAYGTSERVVTNPLGRDSTYRIATAQGNPRVVELDGEATANCVASDTSYTYDANGNVASHVDAEGRVTRTTRDSRGLPLTVTEADGTADARTTTYTWHATWHVPLSITETGRRIDFTYDSGGRLATRTETDLTAHAAAPRAWTYTHSASGLLLTRDGPLAGSADTVSYAYDDDGFLASITDESGAVTTVVARTGSGYPTRIVDPNGIAWALAYDARHRLLSYTVDDGGPLAATTSVAYDALGNVTRLTAPDGSALDYAWNDARRLTRISNALGEEIAFAYDAKGDVTSSTVRDSSGGTLRRQETRTYDEIGRLLNLVGSLGQTTTHGYDREDNLVRRTDPRGAADLYAYDGLDRLQRSTDAEGAATSYTYDARDELTGVTDPRQVATVYDRNGLGDVVSETSPDIGTEASVFDARGLPTRTTDARGVVANNTYDAKGRLVATAFPSAPAENMTYAWDGLTATSFGVGRLASVTDASGSTALGWSRRGELATVRSTIGARAYDVGYAYDAAGRVSTITYPSGREVTFHRDAAGIVRKVGTRQSATADQFEIYREVFWLPFGPFKGATLGNGQRLAHDYTADYELSAISLRSRRDIERTRTYRRDDGVNVTGIDAPQTANDESFAYGLAGRLTSATGPYGSETYGYDLSGNRIAHGHDGVVDTHVVDSSSNRLSGVVSGGAATRSFTHDAAGNLVADARPATAFAYGYDANGGLKSVTRDGTLWASYVSNAFRQRVSRTLTSASGAAAQTHYVYDRDGRLLAEADGTTGQTVREYVWLDDLPIAVIDVSAGNVLYYVVTDHLYRPVELRNAQGSAVWQAAYEPFGAVHAVTGSLTLDARFPGQWFDLETGLHYNWHRHYDPTLGRYIEPDPIGLAGGSNRYAYAMSSPLMYVDPDGRFAFALPLVAPIAISAIEFTAWTVGIFTSVAIVAAMDAATDEPEQERFDVHASQPEICWLRKTSGASAGGGGRKNSKKCDKQYEHDSAICRMLASKQQRAKCWKSAMDRYSDCHEGKPPRLLNY